MNIKINLLPVVKKKRKTEDTNLIIIFVFFVIILGLVYFFYNTRINFLDKTLTIIQANINKLKDMETLKNEKIKSDSLVNYYINTILKLTKNQPKFSDFFKSLSSEFPKYAYITNLDVDLDTKVVRIVGETSDFYNLGRLLDYLKNSKTILNVYLTNFSRQEVAQTGESKITFTLIGILQIGGGK
ncbi:MAG: PilN domain-containing protein [Caldisericia bacterium]|jgi:Tfp pilus assembly protein PilN|nr:PilN domain-containing protein [Caldisericia bacterium]